MKKILFRNLLFNYLGFFFVALISSSVVIWVFQAVNFLDIMVEDGRDYLIYIKYSLLNYPKIFSKLFPFVLFFSLFYVTIKHELNNELIIFWNFGVSKLDLINFILKVSIVLLILQSILTVIIVPKSQDIARSYLRSSTVNFYGNFIKPKTFNDTIKGVTIYSENKDNEGNLKNLYIKKEIGNKEFQIIYAKQGLFEEKSGKPILVLYDGAQLTGKNNQIRNFNFSKSDFPLQSLKTNTTTYKKTQEINSLKLLKCFKNIYLLNGDEGKIRDLKIENCTKKNIENILREVYKRFIIPLYIPFLSLIPFILITSSKEDSFYLKIRIFTFLLGLATVIFSETSIRLISKIFSSNIIFSILPLFLCLITYFVFYKKFNFSYIKNNV